MPDVAQYLSKMHLKMAVSKILYTMQILSAMQIFFQKIKLV
jgi:hypothetical protein